MMKKIVGRYYPVFQEHMRTFDNEKLPFIPLYTPQRLTTLDKIKLNVTSNFYELPVEAKSYFEPIYSSLEKEFSRNYFNSIVYGLTRFDSSSNSIILHKSTFFYEWLMHLQPDRVFYPSAPYTFRDVFDKYLVRDMFSLDNFFPRTLGINGLIFTRDGYLILQERSSDVVIERNTLSVSFGGTFNEFGVSTEKTAIAEKIAEILEREYAITADPIAIASSTYLLSIDANLMYMGKPDIYVFMVVNESYRDFTSTNNEVSYIRGVKLASSFEELVKDPISVTSKLRNVKYEFSHINKSPFLLAILSMLEESFKKIIL